MRDSKVESQARDLEPHGVAERSAWRQEWVVVRRIHILSVGKRRFWDEKTCLVNYRFVVAEAAPGDDEVLKRGKIWYQINN